MSLKWGNCVGAYRRFPIPFLEYKPTSGLWSATAATGQNVPGYRTFLKISEERLHSCWCWPRIKGQFKNSKQVLFSYLEGGLQVIRSTHWNFSRVLSIKNVKNTVVPFSIINSCSTLFDIRYLLAQLELGGLSIITSFAFIKQLYWEQERILFFQMPFFGIPNLNFRRCTTGRRSHEKSFNLWCHSKKSEMIRRTLKLWRRNEPSFFYSVHFVATSNLRNRELATLKRRSRLTW